jgi:hypothetical protein
MDFAHRRGRITYPGLSEAIYDGDTIYVRFPLPWRNPAPWTRLDIADDEAFDPLDLFERAMHNPIGLLEFLRGASDDTQNIGPELIRATSTTRYKGTLDLQRVVDNAPPAKQEELQQWLDFLSESSPTKVPFELWVDGRGLTHRLRLEIGQSESMTADYFDFGLTVAISPPPRSEIISPEQLWKEIELHMKGNCTGDENDDESAGAPAGASDPSTDEATLHLGTVSADTAKASRDSARVEICGPGRMIPNIRPATVPHNRPIGHPSQVRGIVRTNTAQVGGGDPKRGTKVPCT